MIELHEFPWSPYCLVQRRLLEWAGLPHRRVRVDLNDRAALWRLTRERYYQVPVLRDGRQVVFETDADSQVVAKYLDQKFDLGLFPREWEGVQTLLWRHFENDVEGVGFRLNDIHWREFVPRRDHCGFVRHKERRFGRGCLDQWAAQEPALLAELERLLAPAEQMLATRDFLLAPDRPLFVDFCLWGMLANVLYTGHHALPAAHPRLRAWHARLAALKRPA
jgi:glutathione S-transferase